MKEKPFPEFMRWLEMAGMVWEIMADQGLGPKTSGGNGGGKANFFGEQETVLGGSQGNTAC